MLDIGTFLLFLLAVGVIVNVMTGGCTSFQSETIQHGDLVWVKRGKYKNRSGTVVMRTSSISYGYLLVRLNDDKRGRLFKIRACNVVLIPEARNEPYSR